MQGVVKFFAEKGYGFITVEGHKDVFFHATDLKATGLASLNVGDTITFEIGHTKDGREKAIGIKKV